MIVDIIILLLLVLAVVMGIRKGFIAQVIAIISIILGVWLSCKFGTLLGSWSAAQLHTSPDLMKFIAFAVIFVVVIFGLFWFGKFIEKTVKILMLTWLNRLLGVIFSLLKYVLIIGLLLILFDTVTADFHVNIGRSRLYYPLMNAVASVFPYLRDILAIF